MEEVCKVWGITPEEMPEPGVSAYEMFELMEQKTIRGLVSSLFESCCVCTKFKFCSEKQLKNLDFMVCADFYLIRVC